MSSVAVYEGFLPSSTGDYEDAKQAAGNWRKFLPASRKKAVSAENKFKAYVTKYKAPKTKKPTGPPGSS